MSETLELMADYAERFARMSAERGDPAGAAWHQSRADALRSSITAVQIARVPALDRMGITKEQVWHLHSYVVDHAADHEDDCPGDDTCQCSFKARNDAVNAAVQTLIRHLPVLRWRTGSVTDAESKP